MKRHYSNILFILFCVFLAGCATAPKPASGNFKEHVFPATTSKIYSALIKSLQDAKFQFQIQNPESGIIETEWKSESSLLAGLLVGKLQSKIKTTITRLDETHTKVTVEILVEKQTATGTWEPADLVREKDYTQFFNGVQENLNILK
jgi:uncharacterized lipoprotein